MVIGSFIVFVICLLLFLSVLYFDRRNLFLGIFFIATGLSFVFYIMALIVNNATDNKIVYNLGIILLVIAVEMLTLLPIAVVIMFLFNSFMLIKREGLRMGNLLSLATFFLLVGYIVYWPRVATYTYDNILLNTLYVYVSLVVLYFLCIAMSYLVSSVLNFINILPRRIDYVVVLGAGLIGERVTPLLASRITKGIKVYKANPGSKLIMSGGQGPDEVVSEAFAMKNYALEQGVDERDIIMEDKSTSTEENIIFSKRFIPEDKRFAIVTNYYHVYRALVQARTLGYRCIGYGAPTKFYFSLNAFIREFIGYLYFKRKIHTIVLGVLTILFIAASIFMEIYYLINYR